MSIPPPPVRLPVTDASLVPVARRAAHDQARACGLRGPLLDQVALAVTELAENLHRHAEGGELWFLADQETGGALLVLAVDRGPGVARFDRCLVDGYSTRGTMGTGLGAARRLATAFEAVSEVGRGTVVLARFGVPAAPGPVQSAAVGWPVSGEAVNGDAWATVRRGTTVLALLADGLGHGEGAALASTLAAEQLPALADLPVDEVVAALHEGLRHSRGAALTVVRADASALREGGTVQVAGLGNISTLVVAADGGTKRAATSYGTAGSVAPRRIAALHVDVPAGATIVLHSDGLSARFSLDGRAQLLQHSPLLVAAALHRDHARVTDDTSVLVLRATA